MRIKITILLLMVFSVSRIQGQEILTVDEAVAMALKNNFDILVARNESEIARVNNTAGNAGMLPSIKATSSGNLEVNNVHQVLSGGTENNITALNSRSLNAGTQLSWTLFDGGRMFVTKEKLGQIQALGELQFQEKVLQTIYSVIAAYYDIVRQKQQLNSINEAMNFNLERVKITQAGVNAGSMMRPDLLQAKIDLNVTMENAINQKFIIGAAKKYLNELLGNSAEYLFEVSDSIPLNYVPDEKELTTRLDSLNTTILSLKKQSEIARLSLKESIRSYSPVLNLSGGYSLSYSSNSAGNVLNSRSFGPQVGGTLVIPIYSAGENKRKITTSRIQAESAEFDLQNVRLQVSTDLQNALSSFDSQKQLLQIEKENNRLTRENLEISLQRLRLGQTTSLEVHQAQENFVLSCTRLLNFEYNLKIAETKLKQLISSL